MTLPPEPPTELVEIAARAGNGEIFWNEEDPIERQEWRELLLAEARCTLTAVWPALQALVEAERDDSERSS